MVISLRSQQTSLGERFSQKTVFQRQLANLRVQRFDIDLGLFRRLRFIVEDIRHAIKELILPLLDLVRMNIKLQGQLAHRFVALQSRQRDCRFE
jgi:hypothetical protein